MMSEMKALGGLLKLGWRPERTIVYLSWDGEEPGLLGSTEWAETHADELRRKAVLYVNTDEGGRGFVTAEGSHDFQHMVNQAMADVTDPETGASLQARARAGILIDKADGGHPDADALAAADKGGDLPVGALGSGSDYSSYIQHLGLPALNLGFGGEDRLEGVYHSLYDSFHHYTTFDDPGLRYGAALSRFAGRTVLRVADADTPPMRFSDFGDQVGRYLDQVTKLAQDQRQADLKLKALRASDSYRLASDPGRPVAAPTAQAETPVIDFAALAAAVTTLKTSAGNYDAAYAAHGAALSPQARDRLNALLRDVDQLLIDPQGLPGRPWYKNLVYAPGRLTGYGAKTLPGVREGIEDRRFADAIAYIARTAKVLTDYAARLDQARAVVEGRAP